MSPRTVCPFDCALFIYIWNMHARNKTASKQCTKCTWTVHTKMEKSGQSSKPVLFVDAACMADFEIEIQKVQAHGNFRESHWDISQKRISFQPIYTIVYPHIISYTHWWTYFKTMTTQIWFFVFGRSGLLECWYMCCAPCSTV